MRRVHPTGAGAYLVRLAGRITLNLAQVSLPQAAELLTVRRCHIRKFLTVKRWAPAQANAGPVVHHLHLHLELDGLAVRRGGGAYIDVELDRHTAVT